MKKTGNPFIDVLPPLYDLEEFVTRTRHYPAFPPNQTDIEMMVLLTEIYDYFEPLESSHDFYVIMASMLYGGYKRRTPDDIPALIAKSVNLTAEEIYHKIRQKTLTLNSSGGATLIGYPGMGKTLNCLRIHSLFPSYHLHKDFGMYQIPILKLDCPEKGTILQLCRNFFSKIDSIIGFDYSYQYRNASEPELMRQMINKAVIHFIGLLIIDETQNLKVVTDREGEMTMKFIRFLSNEFKVPVIFVGTKQAEEILKKNLQSASRQQASGALKWDRWKIDDEQGKKHWKFIVEGLWDQQVFDKSDLTDGIVASYYKHSMGIHRLLVTVHMAAQRIAIKNQWYQINEEVLRMAAEDEMFLTTKMVLALENKELKLLELWEDMHESKPTAPQNKKTESNNTHDDLFRLAKAVYPKLDKSIVESLVKSINTEFENETLEEKAAILKVRIEEINSTIPQNAQEKKQMNSELLTITENATTSLEAHSVLKEAFIIKDFRDYLSF